MNSSYTQKLTQNRLLQKADILLSRAGYGDFKIVGYRFLDHNSLELTIRKESLEKIIIVEGDD